MRNINTFPFSSPFADDFAVDFPVDFTRSCVQLAEEVLIGQLPELGAADVPMDPMDMYILYDILFI